MELPAWLAALWGFFGEDKAGFIIAIYFFLILFVWATSSLMKIKDNNDEEENLGIEASTAPAFRGEVKAYHKEE